ncbi:MAG: DUF6438 domain-containing protein [Polaribacter sp.]|uniref:DUF6438 domain-containing protein n=1 Tax=Polaribacter sp. TaxID=1920175 RepID=UPI002F358865
MKYSIILIFVFAFGCNTTNKKKEIKVEEKSEIKKEKEVIEKVKEVEIIKTQENLLIVLKDPKEVLNAKALIENSSLVWENLIIDEKNLKVASIKVPIEKKDFWIERLKTANVFSTVEINTETVLENIKYIAENTFVKIRKTHCSGDCPVFDVIFFNDGKVIFNGIENVPLKGINEFTLTEKQLKKVKNIFSKTSFGTYFDTRTDKSIADFPSTFITHKNKEIEIKLWKNVPNELVMAYECLDEILLEKKLIE